MRGWDVTGIGSLGGVDPDAAARDVLDCGLDMPFWPQLPRRSSLEGMVQQAAVGVAGIEPVDVRGSLWRRIAPLVAGRDRVEQPGPTAANAAGFAAFERALGGRRLARVKGQWVGPATLGASLVLDSGQSALHVPQLWSAVLDAVHRAVRLQTTRLLHLADHVDLWLDEPLLTSQAVASAVPAARLRAWYADLARACGPAVRLGVHCCAPPPWDPLFALGVPVLALDTWTYGGEMASEIAALRAHLEQGWVAWGAIPAHGDLPSLDAVLERLEPLLVSVASPSRRPALAARSLVTPGCGLAGLDAGAGRERLGLARACAMRLRSGDVVQRPAG